MKDYYQILGVEKNASDEEIKKAYRKLAHQHHPDKQGGDDKKFKEINEAYQILSDRAKRSQYDQFGTSFDQAGAGGFQGGYNQGPFGGFSDANFAGFDLGDIFSSFFGGERRRRSGGPVRGDDIEISLDIKFAEAVFGVEKKFNLYKRVKCDHCQGRGAAAGAKIITCHKCKGSGRIQQMQQTILGSFAQTIICPECHGEGKIPEKKCQQCGGDGRIRREEEIIIKIPAGIANGQTIELRGKGEAGLRGGPHGNLLVHISVGKHRLFSREGYNLLTERRISFSQAALGDEVTLETLDGKIILKIPPGIQSGTSLVVQGKGVPHLHDEKKGDLLVKVIVVTPKKLSKKEKQLLLEIKNEQGEVSKISDKGFFDKIFKRK